MKEIEYKPGLKETKVEYDESAFWLQVSRLCDANETLSELLHCVLHCTLRVASNSTSVATRVWSTKLTIIMVLCMFILPVFGWRNHSIYFQFNVILSNIVTQVNKICFTRFCFSSFSFSISFSFPLPSSSFLFLSLFISI